MFKHLTGRLLVALDEPPADIETHSVRWALVVGRRCVSEGVCAATRLAHLGGIELLASFFDRAAYFERHTVQTRNPRLAQALARRYIDAQMAFSEPYRLRTKIASQSEAEAIVRSMAATEACCARAADALPMAERPVRLAALVETAIAALVARVTTEPVLVCHLRGNRFLSFLAENGEVRMRRIEIASDSELVEIGDLVERAAVQIAHTDLAQPAARLLLGDLRPLAKIERFQRDYASREVEKKIARLISGADALAEPELFGLPFVRSCWNMLYPEQTRGALAWKLGLSAAGMMLAGSAFAALMASLQGAESDFLAAQQEIRRAALEQKREELFRRIPAAAELQRLTDLAKLIKKNNEQVRIDRFLSWLTMQLPVGATVESLTLHPQNEAPPQAAQGIASYAGAETPAGNDVDKSSPITHSAKTPLASTAGGYATTLTIHLYGTYEQVDTLAAKVMSALGERLSLRQARLEYDGEKTGARLFLQASFSQGHFAR